MRRISSWRDVPAYQGRRISLTKVREEQDTELLYALRRRSYHAKHGQREGPRFLVFFRVDLTLPLVGAADPEL